MKEDTGRTLIDFLISFKLKLLESFIDMGSTSMSKTDLENTFFNICDYLKANNEERNVVGNIIFGNEAKNIIDEHNKKSLESGAFIQPSPISNSLTPIPQEQNNASLTGQNDTLSYSENSELSSTSGETKGNAKHYSSAPWHNSSNDRAA
jgi:hypothetical protein